MYRPGKGHLAFHDSDKSLPPETAGKPATTTPKSPYGSSANQSTNVLPRELYLFPRDEDHIPDWFKEEMKGVKTLGQSNRTSRLGTVPKLIAADRQALDAAWSTGWTVNLASARTSSTWEFMVDRSGSGSGTAFQTSKRGTLSIVASDGLSDPGWHRVTPLEKDSRSILQARLLVGMASKSVDTHRQFELLYFAAQETAQSPGIYRTSEKAPVAWVHDVADRQAHKSTGAGATQLD